MTFRPPVFDNPIDRDKMPNAKLPFEFPAVTYTLSDNQIRTIAFTIFGSLLWFALMDIVGRPLYEDSHSSLQFVPALAKLSIVLLATLQLIRPFARFQGLGEVGAAFTFTMSSLIFLDRNLSANLMPLVASLCLIWSISELALHFITINPLGEEAVLLDGRYVVSLGAVLAGSYAMVLSVLPAESLIAVAVLSLALWISIVSIHAGSGFTFSSLLKYGFTNFLSYPNNHALSPGLVASPAGLAFLRLLPLAMFICTFTAAWIKADSHVVLAEVCVSFAAGTWLAFSHAALAVVITGTPLRAEVSSKWQQAVEANGKSIDSLHRDSIYVGTVAADGSPVQVDRSLLMQHVHFLGSTGSGKTSLGLLPLIEQIVRKGDASVIVIDLKADKLELLASLDAARRDTKQLTGIDIPLRIFSMEQGVRTFACNPFMTQGWLKLGMLERTDIISSALGLDYGPGWGKDFFNACNSMVLLAGNLASPDAMTFRQLFSDVERILKSSEWEGLLTDVKRNGTHAWSALLRMAALDALNVTGPRVDAPDVMQHQIDLASFFESPQLAYFALPSTTGSITSAAISRLIAFFLLVAGKHAARNCKVYLVIDEFQRMAAGCLDQLFQMARGLDISIILANQNMSDLYAIDKGLASSIEANCHWRQYFSVDNAMELSEMERLFGTREEIKYSYTTGNEGTSTTATLHEVPRATITDLQQISDDLHLSIIKITGDRKGYGKYRGIPFVLRSEFHVSQDEYLRRKEYKWPESLPGMMMGTSTFVNRSEKQPGKSQPTPAPIDQESDEQVFESWQSELFE